MLFEGFARAEYRLAGLLPTEALGHPSKIGDDVVTISEIFQYWRLRTNWVFAGARYRRVSSQSTVSEANDPSTRAFILDTCAMPFHSLFLLMGSGHMDRSTMDKEP